MIKEKTTEILTQAKKTIEKIIYITIATSDKNNQPWNTPVYSAYDKKYNFYWMSWQENKHSQNISENNKVFVVIYDSTVPEGTGFGIYMRGKAKKLEKKNIAELVKSLTLLYSRKNKKPRKPEEFLGLLPRRIYKFTPEKIWVNAEGEIKGHFVDERIDITKDILK